jgi:hypothetical protein
MERAKSLFNIEDKLHASREGLISERRFVSDSFTYTKDNFAFPLNAPPPEGMRDNQLNSCVHRSLAAIPAASDTSSVSGTLNRAKPQSKQTKSFGNSQTPGLSIFLSPEK